MNSSLRVVVALVLLSLSSHAMQGCNAPKPVRGGEGRITGLNPQVIYGLNDIELSVQYQATEPELIVYTIKDMGEVHVLFGPNQGDTNPATALVEPDGDFILTSGFAYMWAPVPETSSTGGDTGSGGGRAGMPRPYIRTARVNASGKGSRWAVQIITGADRVYFAEGSYVEFQDANQALVTFRLSSEGTYATATSYTSIVESGSYLYSGGVSEAHAFTAYVDSKIGDFAMPPMN